MGAPMDEAVEKRIIELRAREGNRGRDAKKPTELPAKGWKDVLWRVYEEISNDRIGTIAAGTTFFVLLALFPAIGAFLSLYGLIADPSTVQDHINDISGYVPAAMLDLIGGELKRLSESQNDRTLGFAFISGLAIALWSANNGMKAVFDALNVAYDETEKRSFFKLTLVSFTFTLGAIAFFALLVVVVAGVPIVVKFLNLGPVGDALVAILPALVLFAVASLGIALLYRYGPSRATVQWQWITPGSVGAALIWLVGSALFSWYLSNFANYAATYGSLGAGIGAMMWIYISMWIVLVGAELNSEMEHQTAEDTTTGPSKPLGERGATMADRVGPAKA